ncbi:hypothetical protein HY992_05165 [Candidatus Micrarchaeota archaeon]|nr:hypothetical protein [Candidatus Micrarchaeota archaeon]
MCIQKKHVKGIALSAVAVAIISQVIHTIGAIATMSFYLDPAYFPVWSKIMMPGPGAPPTEFYLLSLASSFITGLLYAGGYSLLIKAIPGKTFFTKGLNYGALLFALASIPFTLSLVLLINLPIPLIIEWAAENMLILLLAGVAIAKLVK